LWARQTGGKFVLRIEDTDSVRNDPASYENILKALDWLGLHWDEGPEIGGDFGPYTQSDRRAIYKSLSDQLIADGKAYRCDCSTDDLDKMRKDFSKTSKDPWKYPGICRDKNVSADAPHVVRFKINPTDIVSYDDLVFGNVKTPISSLYDFVILRESGVPLYNFAAVVDDHLMNINLVGRGRDHMINTPVQILIYMAFGWDIPSFAHLPMMLNMKGEKLAKRDGSASVDQFRAMGFSANGLLNYLMRFGWAHGDQELFSMDEMVKLFSWKHCRKSDGRFDLTKAIAINGKNMMKTDLVSDDTYIKDLSAWHKADAGQIDLVRPKAKTYKEAADLLSFFNDGSLNGPPADISEQDYNHVLNLFILFNEGKGLPLNKESLINVARKYSESHGLKFAELSQTLRYAFTHRKIGPDIYQLMSYLLNNKIVG
jgi:glutamyl-tRNA synthetase